MRLLAAEGVFAETPDGRFELLDMGRALQSGSLERLRVLLHGKPAHWRAAGSLLHGVRAGETPFEHAHGAGFFDWLREHPEEGELFDR